MFEKLLENLQDWSLTKDMPDSQLHRDNFELIIPDEFNLDLVKKSAIDFLIAVEDGYRKELFSEISKFNNKYCSIDIYPDIQKASGLYLLYRIVFDIVENKSPDRSSYFGGWKSPTRYGTRDEKFTISEDLSWPVSIEVTKNSLLIQPYFGYYGGRWDALEEYDYFLRIFGFRKAAFIKSLDFKLVPLTL